MRDSELEFNGKSKTISTPEMPSTYAEFKSMVESGDFTADVVTNPDGYIEFGTPYSKETVLPDTVATDLGLSGDPTIADAFGKMVKVARVSVCRNVSLAGLQMGAVYYISDLTDIPLSRILTVIPELHYTDGVNTIKLNVFNGISGNNRFIRCYNPSTTSTTISMDCAILYI